MHDAQSLQALLTTLSAYFQGEKAEALVFILPLGLLSLVFAGWLITDGQSGFTRGLVIPFLLMGLLMTTVGGVVGYRTPAQEQKLLTELKTDPTQAISTEIVRMEKVNKAWPVYLVIWAAFGVVGLALRFLMRGDFAQGLGVALVFFAGVALLIDGFAERRARPYTEMLESVQASGHQSP